MGSGKDCRLQVQKLNELKGSKEQNLFGENVSPNISQSSDVSPQEATNTTANGTTTEERIVEGTFSKEENHRQCSEINDVSSISTYDNTGAKRIYENNTNCPNRFEGPVAEPPKIETNNSTQSEWNQFLSSDESN